MQHLEETSLRIEAETTLAKKEEEEHLAAETLTLPRTWTERGLNSS